jgi:hypothetical protein
MSGGIKIPGHWLVARYSPKRNSVDRIARRGREGLLDLGIRGNGATADKIKILASALRRVDWTVQIDTLTKSPSWNGIAQRKEGQMLRCVISPPDLQTADGLSSRDQARDRVRDSAT